MAQPPPETIFTRKHNFLKAQTQVLSKPLTPSRKWLAGNAQAGGDDNNRLSDKAVREAVFKANQVIAQHNKRVYAPESLHHIAEQLEGLYLGQEDGAAGGDAAGDEYPAGDGELRLGDDLTNPDSIAKLAPEWPDEDDVAAHPELARDYVVLVEQLRSLSKQRCETEARIARLQRLGERMAPFNSPDGGVAGVQENLATRRGEVESELERMRTLLVRVAGGVAMGNQDGPDEDDVDSLFRGEGAVVVGDSDQVARQRVDELSGRL